MTFERVELRGGELTFDALATGPAEGQLVLLLHGFPQTAAMWRSQLVALAEAGYRAVAPNQRGYASGARPDAVDAYHVDHLVADVLAMADHLGADRLHLVGHDWGAVVAWHFAIRHPDRLRSLTAVSVPHPASFQRALGSGGGDQKERSSYIDVFRAEGGVAERLLLENDSGRLRALLSYSGIDSEALEDNVRAMSEPERLTAALNWYRAMERASFPGSSEVRVPTLFVWSNGDIAVSREAAEGCAEFVSGEYRFEELDGVTHWVPEQAAADLNRLLLEHLASHP